ncbi:MAG: cupin domain-containing protein [Desulfobacter sp.]|nr:MAG: cupin domain-containing protein [Desulfobacter sp.]
MNNIFNGIPEQIPEEIFEDIIRTDNIRIERIVSKGQSSPEKGWYDQPENEWVMVLSGYGIIEFDDGRIITMTKGDHLNIKANERHRVKATSPDEATIWLAVFYTPS